MDRKSLIKNSKIVVIKIGTNSLSKKNGKLDKKSIENFANSISKLQKNGKKVIIVSSGAIGAGLSVLNLSQKPRNIELKQACAALGQNMMISSWSKAFDKYKIKIAQVLLTYDVFSNRKLYLNLKNTIGKLLALGIIPIINENDAIAIDEIGTAFGDNDRLSSMVAAKIQADLLVMITDVDGVFSKNPKTNKDAQLIKKIYDINGDIKRACGGKGSACSTGGMQSKINAAKLAIEAGVATFIINGKDHRNIEKLFSFKSIGTMFVPKEKIASKRSWLKIAQPSGEIHVDTGAKNAIIKGKNLLPAGIINVKGDFAINDVVEIVCDGAAFAKAIIDITSDTLIKVKSLNSSEIKKKFGITRVNVFRRENLIVL